MKPSTPSPAGSISPNTHSPSPLLANRRRGRHSSARSGNDSLTPRKSCDSNGVFSSSHHHDCDDMKQQAGDHLTSSYVITELRRLKISNHKLLRHIERNNRRIDELEQYVLGSTSAGDVQRHGQGTAAAAGEQNDASYCSDTLSLNSTFDHHDKATIFSTHQDDGSITMVDVSEVVHQPEQDEHNNTKRTDKGGSSCDTENHKDNNPESPIAATAVNGTPRASRHSSSQHQAPAGFQKPPAPQHQKQLPYTKMKPEYQQQYEMMLMKKQFMEGLAAAAASPLLFSPPPMSHSKMRPRHSHTNHQYHSHAHKLHPLSAAAAATASNGSFSQHFHHPTKRVHFDLHSNRSSQPHHDEVDEDEEEDIHECGVILSSNDLSRESIQSCSASGIAHRSEHASGCVASNSTMHSPQVSESLPSSIQDMSSESISELKFPSSTQHFNSTHQEDSTSKQDQSSFPQASSIHYHHSSSLLRKIHDLEQKVNLLLQQRCQSSPLSKSQHLANADVSSIFPDPASSFKKLIEFSAQDQSLLDRLFGDWQLGQCPDETREEDDEETAEAFSRVEVDTSVSIAQDE